MQWEGEGRDPLPTLFCAAVKDGIILKERRRVIPLSWAAARPIPLLGGAALDPKGGSLEVLLILFVRYHDCVNDFRKL